MRFGWLVLLAALVGGAFGQGTAFNYQGQLKENGAPVTGSYDLFFVLFDAAGGGLSIGSTLFADEVAVVNGVFTVTLDFGPNAFNGSARWLQIGVRDGSLPNSIRDGYWLLSPRVPVRPSPYATFAATAATVPDFAITTAKLQNSAVTPQKLAFNADGLSQVSGGHLAVGPATGFLVGLDLRINGPQTIRFPSVAGTPPPMIWMFESGTANADRMVLSHSPAFSNWGLQYQDASDRFQFLGGGSSVLSVDLGTQRVGIGVAAPTATLDVNGTGRFAGFQLTAGASDGRVLRSNATGVATWGADGLELPFLKSQSTPDALMELENTAGGAAFRGRSSFGIAMDAVGHIVGIQGSSPNRGVFGFNSVTGTSGTVGGVSFAVHGQHNANTEGYIGGITNGVYGKNILNNSEGFLGGPSYGVYGRGLTGVIGQGTQGGDGVAGYSFTANKAGVLGENTNASGWAGLFQGRLRVTGASQLEGAVTVGGTATFNQPVTMNSSVTMPQMPGFKADTSANNLIMAPALTYDLDETTLTVPANGFLIITAKTRFGVSGSGAPTMTLAVFDGGSEIASDGLVVQAGHQGTVVVQHVLPVGPGNRTIRTRARSGLGTFTATTGGSSLVVVYVPREL